MRGLGAAHSASSTQWQRSLRTHEFRLGWKTRRSLPLLTTLVFQTVVFRPHVDQQRTVVMSSVWHSRDARATWFLAMPTAVCDRTKVSFGIEIRDPSHAMWCGVCAEIVGVTSFHQRPKSHVLVGSSEIVRQTKHVFPPSEHGSLLLKVPW